jgi:hypothetical protein
MPTAPEFSHTAATSADRLVPIASFAAVILQSRPVCLEETNCVGQNTPSGECLETSRPWNYDWRSSFAPILQTKHFVVKRISTGVCRNILSSVCGRAYNVAETIYDPDVFPFPVPYGTPVIMNIGKPWRVYDPTVTTPGDPRRCPAVGLPPPVIIPTRAPYIWFNHYVDPQSCICDPYGPVPPSLVFPC